MVFVDAEGWSVAGVRDRRDKSEKCRIWSAEQCRKNWKCVVVVTSISEEAGSRAQTQSYVGIVDCS